MSNQITHEHDTHTHIPIFEGVRCLFEMGVFTVYRVLWHSIFAAYFVRSVTQPFNMASIMHRGNALYMLAYGGKGTQRIYV